jgi:hypothetical protein
LRLHNSLIVKGFFLTQKNLFFIWVILLRRSHSAAKNRDRTVDDSVIKNLTLLYNKPGRNEQIIEKDNPNSYTYTTTYEYDAPVKT